MQISNGNFFVCFFSFLLFLLNSVTAKKCQLPVDTKGKASSSRVLPAIVRKNVGQWDQQILYKATNLTGSVSLLKDQISFGFSRVKTGASRPEHFIQNEVSEYLIWNMHFEGMNKNAHIIPSDEQLSKTNYIIGNTSFSNVPDYGQLLYKNIYDQVDLRYYAFGQTLKYDFILNPGADINSIKLSCEGIKSLSINPIGELEILTEWGIQKQTAPFAFQIINGVKKKVDVRFFLLNDKMFGFKLYGTYDRNKELIIDPVVLDWCTYMSGSATSTNGYQFCITSDTDGNIYGTGYNNNSFPLTAGVYDSSYNGDSGSPLTINGMGDVFVYKMDPSATTLIYSTFIGGKDDEAGRGIKVNSSGEAFVTGITKSSDFPSTAGAYQTSNGGSIDVFSLKLNATGTALLYSTFLGGNADDWAYDNALNKAGEVFITGSSSAGFPTSVGAFMNNTGYIDAIVVRLSANGTKLVYSTFVGSTSFSSANTSAGYAIAIDTLNNAYVTGSASGSFFTVSGSFDVTLNGASDAFVFKLNPAGSNLIYSTYLGGSGNESSGYSLSYYSYGMGIDINTSGEAFVTGGTTSIDFPVTIGAFSTTLKGGTNSDVFVSRLNASGTALIYSTYLGGTDYEMSTDIKVNKQDEAYVTGSTTSIDFPVTSCTYNDTAGGGRDVFLTKLNATGSQLQYCTYFGGSDNDYSDPTIALVKNRCTSDVVVGFTTHSPNLPTTVGVIQPLATVTTFANDQPAIFKLKPKLNPGFAVSPLSLNSSFTFTDTTSQCGLFDTLTTHHWDFGDGATADGISVTHAFTNAGIYSVKLIVGCPNDTVTQLLDNSTTVVPQIISSNEFIKIIPNPSEGVFQLLIEKSNSEIDLKITDIEGRLVCTRNIPVGVGTYSTQIDLSTVGKGMYLIKVSGSRFAKVEKVLVY